MPDWVSSFAVHDTSAHTDRENLSHEVLQHLAQHGLEPDASGILASDKGAKDPDREWISFPWLVVQHDKPDGTGAQCYHGAANAATAAVMMMERLCKFIPAGIRGKANEHVPLVVAITTVKKTVRVWITYSSRPSFDDVAKFVSSPLPGTPNHACFLAEPWVENGVYLGRRHDGYSRSYEVLGHPLQRPQVGITRTTCSCLGLH